MVIFMPNMCTLSAALSYLFIDIIIIYSYLSKRNNMDGESNIRWSPMESVPMMSAITIGEGVEGTKRKDAMVDHGVDLSLKMGMIMATVASLTVTAWLIILTHDGNAFIPDVISGRINKDGT
jgi:hypothetical protein